MEGKNGINMASQDNRTKGGGKSRNSMKGGKDLILVSIMGLQTIWAPIAVIEIGKPEWQTLNVIDRIQVSKTECHVKVELLINQTLMPKSKKCVSKSEQEKTKIRVERGTNLI